MTAEPIYLEVGARRTFAGALEWPGWLRAARTVEGAVEALIACAPRYATALSTVGLTVEPPHRPEALTIAERLEGNSGTDFGVPSRIPTVDERPLDGPDLERLILILEAAWSVFDSVASRAVGHPLRLGPRGGGRDLGKIMEHVREAEAAYLHQLGARAPRPVTSAGLVGHPDRQDLRGRALEALRARASGAPVTEASRVKRPWPPRYHVRRAAWHLLDHAWEVEDRMLP